MTTNGIEPTALPGRTLNDIYEHYLTQTKVADGKTAADRLDGLLGGKRLTIGFRSLPNFRGRETSDAAFQEQLKKADEQIGEIRNRVRRVMVQEASNGTWVAMGRSHPDRAYELIPPRYWPFLTLDLENDAAAGDGISFRELRCWIVADLPADDPIREYLRTAQQRTTTLQTKDSGTPTNAAPNSVQPLRTGTPGRPTSFYLAKQEFERRREAQALTSSLRAEAEHLERWVKDHYPDHPPLTAKTIANKLRDKYREARRKLTSA